MFIHYSMSENLKKPKLADDRYLVLTIIIFFAVICIKVSIPILPVLKYMSAEIPVLNNYIDVATKIQHFGILPILKIFIKFEVENTIFL
jgi:hypothetical protein